MSTPLNSRYGKLGFKNHFKSLFSEAFIWKKSESLKAYQLFKKTGKVLEDFYDIEPIFPKTYLYKRKHSFWCNSEFPMPEKNGTKTDVIPVIDLKGFRRKLVVVLPPNMMKAYLRPLLRSLN